MGSTVMISDDRTEDDMSNDDDEREEDDLRDPNDPPAVLSPGDSDAPDAPDPETVYPDEQGAPGEPVE
jgi:hypothetical protein